MFQRTLRVACFSGCVFISVSCLACLWDRDTLAMERQRFPTVLELISGKFLRHSPDFYRWRIARTRELLKSDAKPELYDDLAVAHEKLGDTDSAIRVTLEKESTYPGLYSTSANLGTFYIHAGDFASGLKEIDKALAINPDAHFGREIYQKLLVEYLLSKNEGSEISLPVAPKPGSLFEPCGFGAFLLEQPEAEETKEAKQIFLKKAIKGVLGMMKFGNYDSPVLLEALGDLLLSQGYETDAKRLAARAYLKASYEVADPKVSDAYRTKAKECLNMQTRKGGSNTPLQLEELEAQFKMELNDAGLWYKAVIDDEQKWISSGADVQAEFERKYYQPPAAGAGYRRSGPSIPLIVGSVCVVLVFCFFVLKSKLNTDDAKV